MGIALAFILGIGNFAAQRAFLESGHPMLASLAPGAFRFASRVSLILEFCLLVAAMLALQSGLNFWLGFYLTYTVFNIAAAYLMASGRI